MVTAPAVGARFKGTNRIGKTSWSTKPTVTVADRGRHFAFKVPGKSGARWSYEFSPIAEGTLVTESMSQEVASQLPIRIIQRRAGVTDRALAAEIPIPVASLEVRPVAFRPDAG